MSDVLQPRTPGNLLARTLALYPQLGPYAHQMAFRASPADNTGRASESYAPYTERDSFAPKKFAIETFDDSGAKPRDIVGEIVSHWLGRGVDPALTRTYNQFTGSITPEQRRILHEQYAFARTHEGEQRPFAAWQQVAGLPAYFRGRAMKQWPKGAVPYTNQQKRALDAVLATLRVPFSDTYHHRG